MKGTFFKKPAEYQLLVSGESWNQGDPVEGSLTIRNHGAAPLPIQGVRVILAEGDLKKVRQKSSNALHALNAKGFSEIAEIAPGTSVTLPWKFELERNSPITDSSSSLLLLYGEGNDLLSYGQLQLLVMPEMLIQEFLKILEVEFRFALKAKKAAKDGVEIKLSAPEGKSFALVENLILNFRFEGEALAVTYTFQVKKLETTSTGFGASKQKRLVKQLLSPIEHIKPGARLHQENTEKLIRDALAVVESKILF